MMQQASSTSIEPLPQQQSALVEAIGPKLTQALLSKGYLTLTPVQERVIAPGLLGNDLRISSQTGSGKTVAIGFALRRALEAPCSDEPIEAGTGATERARAKLARPRAIIIVPTRELAKQVQLELSWLYAPMKVRVTSVTGGASYRDQLRELARAPGVVVGTPGRLLDHLKRGAINPLAVGAVVLDEADQMLDLGFREELEAILAQMPADRRTHLVSATFPREVCALADRFQKDAKRVEGTPLGSANADIDHVVHLIETQQRVAALINVLLHHPGDQTLVFARTRADVADIARELQAAGFAAGSLSGEMDQTARNRALHAFKRGELRALVATDVAARGIDVQDIARVVQVGVPENADSYTHRSGRTGRAGRQGTSVLLIPRGALPRVEQLLHRARVKYKLEPVPSAETIRNAQDERWLAELTEQSVTDVPKRIFKQMQRIVEGGNAEAALVSLLTRLQQAQGEPREVTKVAVRPVRGPGSQKRNAHGQLDAGGHGGAGSARGRREGHAPWAIFRVTCGEVHGADKRRLVAMLCRRGRIRGSDIGAIRVGPTFSDVQVSKSVASSFAEATRRADPRDPTVKVSLFSPRGPRSGAEQPPAGSPRSGKPKPRPFKSKRKKR